MAQTPAAWQVKAVNYSIVCHLNILAKPCIQSGYVLVVQTTLASNSGVGPFARLRAGASIDSGAYIGNFCELKGAHVGEGGNVCHLSYLGDADVGARANIGAGTITCNYSEHLASPNRLLCC